MISYAPLWETMQKRGATTYTLKVKGGVSSSTIRRLKAGESVSTNTLEALCKILDCTLQDVVEYLLDNRQLIPENPNRGQAMIGDILFGYANRLLGTPQLVYYH